MPSSSDYDYLDSLKDPSKAEQALFDTWKKEHDELFGTAEDPGVLRQTESEYLDYVDGLDSEAQNNQVTALAQDQVPDVPTQGYGVSVATGSGGRQTDRFLDKAIRKSLAGRSAIGGLTAFKTGERENAIAVGKGGGDMARSGLAQVAGNAANTALNDAGYEWQQSQDTADMIGFGVGLAGSMAYDAWGGGGNANPYAGQGYTGAYANDAYNLGKGGR